MANSEKNILIIPNTNSTTADPKIIFTGADASTTAQNITLQTYPINNGTLSFEGSAGQLFSISNSLNGTIYSVNDISGLPSIEVLDTGLIKLGQYGGNVLLGTATDNAVNKLQVNGITKSNGYVSNQISYTASGGTLNLDFSLADNFYLTMTANTTLTVSNVSQKIGGTGNIIIKENSTGGWQFTKATEMKTPLGGASIVQVTTANSLSVISYYVVDSSTILINYIGNFA